MHPIVIIGSGMAGYAAAREFRKLNTEQELVMICADDAANYAKPTLSNAPLSKSHLVMPKKWQHNSICAL